jgi:hypothetical protein
MTVRRARRNDIRVNPGVAWLGIAVASLLLLSNAAFAISISVSQFDLNVVPGERGAFSFHILNEEAETVLVDLSLIDWDDAPDNAISLLVPGSLEQSCASWIELAAEGLTLPPGREVEVGWAISVPPAARGTSWCGILVRLRPVDAPLGSGARQFLIKIFQTSKPAVSSARVTGLEILGLNPVTVSVRVLNDGETRLGRVSGLVTVEDAAGASLLAQQIGPFSVLPGHEVELSVEGRWPIREPGIYLLRAVIDYGAEHLVAGQTAFRLAELALEPIGDSPWLPRDPDGDGLYEDIDGDGTLGDADVATFAAHLDDDSIQRNVRAFDFTNDGMVDSADVERLASVVSKEGG